MGSGGGVKEEWELRTRVAPQSQSPSPALKSPAKILSARHTHTVPVSRSSAFLRVIPSRSSGNIAADSRNCISSVVCLCPKVVCSKQALPALRPRRNPVRIAVRCPVVGGSWSARPCCTTATSVNGCLRFAARQDVIMCRVRHHEARTRVGAS